MIQGIVSLCSSSDISFEEIISEVDGIFYLLSIAIQVVFLVHYDGAIRPNTPLFYYSIALMIVDHVWVWLNVTLSKLGDISSQFKVEILPTFPFSNFSGNISFLHNSFGIESVYSS